MEINNKITNEDIELINNAKINQKIQLHNGTFVKIKEKGSCFRCYMREKEFCDVINCLDREGHPEYPIYIAECKNNN